MKQIYSYVRKFPIFVLIACLAIGIIGSAKGSALLYSTYLGGNNDDVLSWSGKNLARDIIFSLLGFYDGDGIWKLRVSPTLPGLWKVDICSEDRELNQSVTFECVPNYHPKIHGRLRVDGHYPPIFYLKTAPIIFYWDMSAIGYGHWTWETRNCRYWDHSWTACRFTGSIISC